MTEQQNNARTESLSSVPCRGCVGAPKVILICGKICCGKSTYAEKLCRTDRAVLLSVDEIMLSVFGQHCGDNHDKYTARVQKYLFDKSLCLARNGISSVLDWGFWTKESRNTAREFYRKNDIGCKFHFIDICDEEWQARLKKRNHDVLCGNTNAYYVDENLAAKFESRFEMPDRSEIDVWINE